MSEETASVGVVEYLQQNSEQIAESVGEYGYLIGDSLVVIDARLGRNQLPGLKRLRPQDIEVIPN